MTLANVYFVKNANGSYSLGAVEGNKMTWLVIETACFYLYMLAAVIYILIRQLQSAWCDAVEVSDRKKALMDFLGYSHYNLVWFSLNFVLCTMPMIALWFTDVELDMNFKDHTLVPITITLWVMHIIAFITQAFIYNALPHKEDHD